ncbi:RNA-directed DNA polymerase, eukaryota, reverse transcriptase zinc-binding domain protein [Tanacetum coccineum]
MAVQNKLMTRDKIDVWKPNEILECALCSQCPDSHNHLIFNCPYSSKVWSLMQNLADKKFSHCWNTTIEEVTNNNIWIILRRLVLGAVVYFIWQERNTRIFRISKRDEQTLVQIITETVELRMMSFIVKESKSIREMECKAAKM